MTDPVDVPLPDDDDSRRKSEHVQGIVQETIERQRKKGILNQKNQDKEEQKPAQQTTPSIFDGVRKRVWSLSTTVLCLLSFFGGQGVAEWRHKDKEKEALAKIEESFRNPQIPKAPASSLQASAPVPVASTTSSPVASTGIVCSLVGDGVHVTKEAEKAYSDAFNAFMNASSRSPEYEKVSKTYENAKNAYVPVPVGQEVAKETISSGPCDKWEKQKALELFVK